MAVEQGSYKGVTLYQGEDYAKRIAEIDAQTAAPTSTPTATKTIDTSKLSTEITADDIEDDDFMGSGTSFQDALAGQLKLQQQAFQGALQSMMISPEEDAAQAQIDALNQEAALRKGYAEGQGMDLEFVQGQQANIERQRAIKTSALEQKLARLQQGRLTQGEIYQALYNGIDHQIDTSLKLKQATMPNLLETFTDDKTGEIFGLFQDIDGNIQRKVLGSVTPETVKDFDIQGTFDNGSQIVAYGYDKDGKFITKSIGGSFRATSGGGTATGSGGSYYESIVKRELDEGNTIEGAVAAAKIVADEFGDKVSTTGLYSYAQTYQKQGSTSESVDVSSLTGTDALNQLLYPEEKPAYTPPVEGSLKFNDVNSIDWDKAAKFFTYN